jgi:branched-chain amino acid transport system permease protein
VITVPMKRFVGGLVIWLGILTMLLALPGHVSRGNQELVLTLLIWVGVAQAWNIIGGIGGQMSLGHSVSVGAGGYTVAMIMIELQLGWLVALVGAVVVSALVAWLLAFPLLRLSGVHFTIGSSAVALGLLAWMVTWEWTGESRGLNIPLDAIPDRATKFRVVAFAACLVCVVTYLLLRSTFGLRLMAVRDNEDAAAAVGVSPRRVKGQAFVLSAALTGLMGGVVALNQASIEPNSMFSLTWSVTALVMVIVGGMGTLWGPVIGAYVIYYVVDRSLDNQPVLQALLSGVLIIAVIILFPGGIMGVLQQGWTWLTGLVSRGKTEGPTSAASVSEPASVTTS